MQLNVTVSKQPDDESCGITCLQAIYRYYGNEIPLETLKSEVEHWQTGGTVSVNLGRHALNSGFNAEIYPYNIKLFDPTWKKLNSKELQNKLNLSRKRTRSKKQKKVIGFYLDFLRKGGILKFDDLDEDLFDKLFSKKKPIIVGLSATYLYQSMRETPDNEENDIIGGPVGHFAVVSAWDRAKRLVAIHDPMRKNPFSETGTYMLPFTKFTNAVMLGVLTYDENLLVISPETNHK